MKIVNDVEVLTTIEELVNPAWSAVLVIDMQNKALTSLTYEEPGFDFKNTEVSNLTTIIPHIQEIIVAARRRGIFISYAEWIDRNIEGVPLVNGPHPYTHRDNSSPANIIEGSWEAQTVDELAPREGDYIDRKSWSSAFYHTGLDDVLRGRRIRCLLITGCITGGCVLKTAVDASHHDYYPVVIKDCVSSYNQESHDLAMTWLETKFPVFHRNEVISVWGKK